METLRALKRAHFSVKTPDLYARRVSSKSYLKNFWRIATNLNVYRAYLSSSLTFTVKLSRMQIANTFFHHVGHTPCIRLNSGSCVRGCFRMQPANTFLGVWTQVLVLGLLRCTYFVELPSPPFAQSAELINVRHTPGCTQNTPCQGKKVRLMQMQYVRTRMPHADAVRCKRSKRKV